MQDISITDQTWATTFPRLISIRENEWLVGVLLRCDESNHWSSGSTLAYLLDTTSKRKLKQRVELLSEIHLKKLASVLAVSLASIVATTSQEELVRIRGGMSPRTKLSHSSVPFHLCPICVADSRFLARTLALPGITHCPRHQISLVARCQCGTTLLPFFPSTVPFTCSKCGLNWAEIPYVHADTELIEAEQKLLSHLETRA